MKDDVINILATHQNHKELGLIAKEALEFIKGKTFKIWQSSNPGQSSLSIANMYRVRKANKLYRAEAFLGVEESISSLAAKDVIVHLSVIETEQGVVSVWLIDDRSPPAGIVVGKFLPLNKFDDQEFGVPFP